MLNVYYIVLIVFSSLLRNTCTRKLPDYIRRCTLSDPQFDDCVLDSANKAVWQILKGDEAYGLPTLVPLKLHPMSLDISRNVHFELSNGIADMTDDFTFTNAHFDFDRKKLSLASKVSQHRWYVDYEATGRILGKPFHEKGKANMTFDGVWLNSTVILGFKEVEGEKYLEVRSTDTTSSSIEFAFGQFDQETIGEPLTDKQVKALKPYYQKTVLSIRKEIKHIADAMIGFVLNVLLRLEPFDDIFLP